MTSGRTNIRPGEKRAYENLANAIVEKAVEDWRDAVRRLKRYHKSQTAAVMKADCESFFLSPYCEQLCGVDGKYILARLKKEAGLP